MPTTAVHPKRKPKDSYYDAAKRSGYCLPRKSARNVVCAGECTSPPTEGGRELAANLRVPLLERKVEELSGMVQLLYNLIDKRELAAASRLAKMTPNNATLKLWIERSNSYPELAAESEERPW